MTIETGETASLNIKDINYIEDYSANTQISVTCEVSTY